jgi:hypothetical protein
MEATEGRFRTDRSYDLVKFGQMNETGLGFEINTAHGPVQNLENDHQRGHGRIKGRDKVQMSPKLEASVGTQRLYHKPT